jgi:hypothetical protein
MLSKAINKSLKSSQILNHSKVGFAAAARSTGNVGRLDENGEPRFLENVKMFLQRAANKTTIPADMYEYIEKCNSVVRFNIPLKMDDGSLRTIPCYR